MNTIVEINKDLILSPANLMGLSGSVRISMISFETTRECDRQMGWQTKLLLYNVIVICGALHEDER